MKTVWISLDTDHGTYWAAQAKVDEVAQPAARFHSDDHGFTYIPDDTAGDVQQVFTICGFFGASWKGVNLIHKWGECYTPLSWGEIRKKSANEKLFLPDSLPSPITANLVPDLPVQTSRSAAGVEYPAAAFRQSDFTKDDVSNLAVPRTSPTEHLNSDVPAGQSRGSAPRRNPAHVNTAILVAAEDRRPVVSDSLSGSGDEVCPGNRGFRGSRAR